MVLPEQKAESDIRACSPRASMRKSPLALVWRTLGPAKMPWSVKRRKTPIRNHGNILLIFLNFVTYFVHIYSVIFHTFSLYIFTFVLFLFSVKGCSLVAYIFFNNFATKERFWLNNMFNHGNWFFLLVLYLPQIGFTKPIHNAKQTIHSNLTVACGSQVLYMDIIR